MSDPTEALQKPTFQYLKGAIGRNRRGPARRALLQFQYLKGAIGRLILEAAAVVENNFNTSKVRLEASQAAPSAQQVAEFQYLKGAIGSRARGRMGPPPMQFQYLKGAIGSPVVASALDTDPNFNTSKVRLEALQTQAKRTWSI